MKENIELEKFQEDAYNDNIGTYKFEIKGPDGKTNISSDLQAKKLIRISDVEVVIKAKQRKALLT